MFDHSINNMILLDGLMDEETEDKRVSQLEKEMKIYQQFI